MTYAKFIDDTTIEYAPHFKDGISNYHLDINRLKQDGYCELLSVPQIPNDDKYYTRKYRLINNQIEPFWAETPKPIKSYAQLRAEEYPPMTEYLDAQVKINSGDETLIAEGQAQEQAYFDYCLAVKAKYPKPTLNNGDAENE